MNRLFVPLAAAALVAVAAGCSNTTSAARPAGETGENPTKIVATIGDEKITLGDLDAEIKTDLESLEKQYQAQKNQLRESSLEGMIAKKLMAAEAARQGISEEEVMNNVVEGKTAPVTEEEIKAFYDQQSMQAAMQGMPGGLPPYEQLRDRMEAHLNQRRKAELAVAYLEKLKAEAGVVISLVDPIQVDATGPSKGPANAPVTIVAFSDFECPYCSKANESLDQVLETYGDKVRIVFRDFPLSFHANAKKAAEAGHCADDQGKFWEMHDKMFENQRALQVDDLKAYAKEVGVDAAKFDACLDEGKKADLVAKNMADGEAVGVTGTPAFFINGKMLAGALPFEEFQKVIDTELLRAGQ